MSHDERGAIDTASCNPGYVPQPLTFHKLSARTSCRSDLRYDIFGTEKGIGVCVCVCYPVNAYWVVRADFVMSNINNSVILL